MLGLEFSEKSWVYLLALQLLFSEGSSSLISGLVGLSVGYLYERNGFGIQKLRMPAMIMVNICEVFLLIGIVVCNRTYPVYL